MVSMNLHAHSTDGEGKHSKKLTTSSKETKNLPEFEFQTHDVNSTKSRKRHSTSAASVIVEPPTKIEKNDDLAVAPITQASALVSEDKGTHPAVDDEISGKQYLIRKLLASGASATVRKPNKAVTKKHVAMKSSRKGEMDSDVCSMEMILMEQVCDANKTLSSRQNLNLRHNSSFTISTRKFAQLPKKLPGIAVPSPGTYTTWSSEQLNLFMEMCKSAPGSSVGVLNSLPMIDGTPIMMQDMPSSSLSTPVRKDSEINDGPSD